jgi:hypothetical protein
MSSASPGGWYPKNPLLGQELQGVEGARTVDLGFVAHVKLTAAEAAAADTDAVHAAVQDNGAQQVITTGFTNPPYPRNITATAGGTAGDIKAIQVTVEGTNDAGETITETLPAFTVDTPGTVVGNKAFKTVTKVTIPAHDGTGATTAIGFGDKIGLPYKLAHNTVQDAYLNNTREGTPPTVAVSISALESNTVDLNSALNGTAVDIYLFV